MEHAVHLETQRMLSKQTFSDVEDISDSEMMRIIADAKPKHEGQGREQAPKGLSTKLSWCSRSADVSNEDITKQLEERNARQIQLSKDHERDRIERESRRYFACAVCSSSISGKEWFMSGNSKHCSIKCAERTANQYLEYLAEQQEVLDGDPPRDLFATLL